MQRVVWDQRGDKTYIIRDGKQSSVLSGRVGKLLSRFKAANHSPANYPKYPLTEHAAAALGFASDDPWAIALVPDNPHLKRIQIETSLRCNLRCSYCYSTSGPERTEHLSSAQVKDIIREAHAIGVLAIDFTGGEFLLQREWATYVELARSYGMIVTIHTNGTMLNKLSVGKIRDLNVSCVQVSIDSHIDEIHDASRGVPNALKRTLRGIETLCDYNVQVQISLMAHQANKGTIGETISAVKQRFPEVKINVDRIVASGGAANSSQALNPGEYWTLMRPYLGDKVRSGKICESPGIEDFEPGCGVAYSYVYVTADGEYASCPTMTSREGQEFEGPRVSSVSLKDAWYQSDFFRSFRYTNCENVQRCPAGMICGGGCRSNAYVESNRVTAPDVVACNIYKNRGPVFIDFPKRYSRNDYSTVEN